MKEIEPEFPKGQRSAEMLLVNMLREIRSWDDYNCIVQALWNIRYRAESMKKEDRKRREEMPQRAEQHEPR